MKITVKQLKSIIREAIEERKSSKNIGIIKQLVAEAVTRERLIKYVAKNVEAPEADIVHLFDTDPHIKQFVKMATEGDDISPTDVISAVAQRLGVEQVGTHLHSGNEKQKLFANGK